MTEELETLLRGAASLGDEGAWQEAYTQLSAGLADYPDEPSLLCALGVAARHLDAEGAAYEYFRRAVAEEPEDPVLLATAGSGLAELGDPDAERILRLAALSAPGCAPARLAYGRYLAREGMTDAAVAEFRAAAGIGDEHFAEAQREIGLALLRVGSINAASQALELADQEPWIVILRALALIEAGENGEAAELLHAAAEADAEDFELQILAALSCAAEGWDDASWNALARAELAAGEQDQPLLVEVEESLHDGPEAARELLLEEVAPSVLRERLLYA